MEKPCGPSKPGLDDEGEDKDWTPQFPTLTCSSYVHGVFVKEDGAVTNNQMDPRKTVEVTETTFFRLKAIIRRGYIEAVYSAEMRQTGKIYALKMYNKIAALKANMQKNIIVEQEVLSLNKERKCNFIVGFHSSFQTKSHLFLVMEFVAGGTLEGRLSVVEKVAEAVASFYIAEIALAVFFLHNEGVIMRDLKTANVLVGADGHIRVCDFGLAKTGMKNNPFTSTMCGTARNMAPEVHQQALYNKAVDYWALGIILYRMVNGKFPFEGKTRVEVIKSITTEKENYIPGLSLHCIGLCRELLTKSQKKRLGYDEDSAELFKSHPFFNQINWFKMESAAYIPPYIPGDPEPLMTESQWPGFIELGTYELKRRVIQELNKPLTATASATLGNDLPASTDLTAMNVAVDVGKGGEIQVKQSHHSLVDEKQQQEKPQQIKQKQEVQEREKRLSSLSRQSACSVPQQPGGSTATAYSSRMRRKGTRHSITQSVRVQTKRGCMKCCVRCKECLSNEMLTCSVICCGPENVDRRWGNGEPVQRRPYTVDNFSEVRTVQPGGTADWVGLTKAVTATRKSTGIMTPAFAPTPNPLRGFSVTSVSMRTSHTMSIGDSLAGCGFATPTHKMSICSTGTTQRLTRTISRTTSKNRSAEDIRAKREQQVATIRNLRTLLSDSKTEHGSQQPQSGYE